MVDELQDPRRHEPSFVAGEREMLEAWLEYHRITLLIKCEGLDDADRKRRPIPTSNLSLHGLVRHMAEVERNWFRRVLTREPDAPYIWADRDVDDSELVPLDDADWEADLAAWQAECEAGRRAAAVRDARRHRYPPRQRVLVALDLQPHDRGVRPPQRARRHHPRAHRRQRRRLGDTVDERLAANRDELGRPDRDPPALRLLRRRGMAARRPRAASARARGTGRRRRDLRLLHLQCHFGLDTLTVGARRRARHRPRLLAGGDRRGARRSRSERAWPIGRVRVFANVYDAANALGDATFDIVYVSLGALCWLPSVDQLGRAGRCARRARRPLLHPRRSSARVGVVRRQSRGRAHLLRRARSVRRRLGRDVHRRRSAARASLARTSGTTPSARSSPR